MNADVLIVGGGASGMTAAITAARRGKRVVLFEANDRLGKKLLATGNGKCNLARRGGLEGAYNDERVARIVAEVGEETAEAFFRSLGLLLRTDAEGRVYPYDELASSVLNVLRKELDRLAVDVRLGTPVRRIERTDRGYRIADVDAPKLIFATGSAATFGTDSLDLAPLPKRAFCPSLVPVLTDPSAVAGLKGVRFKAEAILKESGREVARERGEILVKDNGLSGIAIFDLSARMARQSGNYEIVLDFFPDVELRTLASYLAKGTEGVCHKELARNVARRLGAKIDAASASDAAAILKAYSVPVRANGSMTLAQAASGGIALSALSDTLEAHALSGFYAVGEAVDADGLCGGYNLLWAWTSGMIAGASV